MVCVLLPKFSTQENPSNVYECSTRPRHLFQESRCRSRGRFWFFSSNALSAFFSYSVRSSGAPIMRRLRRTARSRATRAGGRQAALSKTPSSTSLRSFMLAAMRSPAPRATNVRRRRATVSWLRSGCNPPPVAGNEQAIHGGLVCNSRRPCGRFCRISFLTLNMVALGARFRGRTATEAIFVVLARDPVARREPCLSIGGGHVRRNSVAT